MSNTDGNLAALVKYERKLEEADIQRSHFDHEVDMLTEERMILPDFIYELKALCEVYDYYWREELEIILEECI